jgi:hypothetical protein
LSVRTCSVCTGPRRSDVNRIREASSNCEF